jgi:hypothetical protein
VRTYLVGFAILAGVVVGLATLPVNGHWLHLSNKHDHRDGSALIAHTRARGA